MEEKKSDDAASQAIRRLLRPVVHLLIRKAIAFPFAAEMLKGLYVEVGLEDFPVDGKAQTDSRINLLTGVHRKDVKRLRNSKRLRRFESPQSASLTTQVLARWTTQSRYLDAEGKPRPLPRLSSAKQGTSFESLVKSVSTDIRPRVILDEWLRLGLAEIDAEERICLKSEAFVPQSGSDEIAYYFGRNAHDHIAAAVSNLSSAAPPFLERSVAYNHLGEDAVEELQKLARRRGTELLHELNSRALDLQQRDSGMPGATHRMNFGLYFYSEDESPDPKKGGGK
jgi:hypothetical protein